MPRARVIKPGFFKNEDLADIPLVGRILFQGMWCLADREGRLEDRPRRIKAEILPYDECDAEAMVSQLASKGFIQRYEGGGLQLIQIVNWSKHQKPHNTEAASILPAPDGYTVEDVAETEDNGELTVNSPLNNESVTPLLLVTSDSLLVTRDESETPRGRTRAKAEGGTTLPPDFVVTDDLLGWATAKSMDYDVYINPILLAEKFITYYREGKGKTKRQLDWPATWHQWVLSEIEKGGHKNGQQPTATGNSNGTAKARSTERAIREEMEYRARRQTHGDYHEGEVGSRPATT